MILWTLMYELKPVPFKLSHQAPAEACILRQRYFFSPVVNCVHGPVFMSFRIGFK